jgi:hypothetical protein
MAQPLPKDNRCSRCGEWFHNAHACSLTADERAVLRGAIRDSAEMIHGGRLLQAKALPPPPTEKDKP